MSLCSKCNQFLCTCNDFSDNHSFKCPKKIPTPVFSSPNSALSEEQLNELQLCIEEANNLLRSLGSQSDPENTRQLQLHLLKLQGVQVTATIKCMLEKETEVITMSENRRKTTKTVKKQLIEKVVEKDGFLVNEGRGFIQLNTTCGHIFILYEKLVSISHINKFHEQEPYVKELIKNKEIVLNFGNFVSKRPKLINLFFGIPLYLQLQNFIGKDIQVKTDMQMVSGNLVSVDENNIQIKNLRRVKQVNINDTCFIEFNTDSSEL